MTQFFSSNRSVENLSEFAQKIRVPGDGKVFVLTGDGRVLVSPSESGQELRSLLLSGKSQPQVARWRVA